MALGMAYDSDEGRSWAAAVTSLMCGEAYTTSARMAARMGPFPGFEINRESMLRVLGMHRDAAEELLSTGVAVGNTGGRIPRDASRNTAEIALAAVERWHTACELGAVVGVRNAQATVLAPTGTIGFLMDCDTTGIEPDLGLVDRKSVV